MNFIKLVVLLAVFVYGAIWSVGVVKHDTDRYREMMLADPDAPPPLPDPVTAVRLDIGDTYAPPVGFALEDDVWDFDIPGEITTRRRATMSDIKSVYFFIPERCMKCHEEAGPGPNFYGNENPSERQVFMTADGLMLLSFPEKKIAPTLNYIYKERHLKKVPFDEGAPYEIYMKRGQ